MRAGRRIQIRVLPVAVDREFDPSMSPSPDQARPRISTGPASTVRRRPKKSGMPGRHHERIHAHARAGHALFARGLAESGS
jgi:hypothetical protein